MKIKFLKDCEAPQEAYVTHCECCGPERIKDQPTFFQKGEEIDPTNFREEVDLSGLKYKEDYEIIEYP